MNTYEITHWTPGEGHHPRINVSARNRREALDAAVELNPELGSYEDNGQASGMRRVDPETGSIISAFKVEVEPVREGSVVRIPKGTVYTSNADYVEEIGTEPRHRTRKDKVAVAEFVYPEGARGIDGPTIGVEPKTSGRETHFFAAVDVEVLVAEDHRAIVHGANVVGSRGWGPYAAITQTPASCRCGKWSVKAESKREAIELHRDHVAEVAGVES